MRYRNLGNSGIRVSEIGFGCWGIGGDHGGAVAYGKTDDAVSLKAVHAALDCGINFFDTADFYGNGHSEELLGQALQGRRNSVVIASKGGMLTPAGDQDFSADHIRAAVEGSLRRLQTDYIDLYQWHSPPVSKLAEFSDTAALLDDFKRAGKIRQVAFSARSPEEGLTAAKSGTFASVQVNFNLADQRALGSGLIEYCEESGVGLVIRTPLCFGFLTGEYSAEQTFAPGDHRARWSVSQRESWSAARTAFRTVHARYATMTAAQFALSYCLSYSAVSTTIPGMLTPDQVAENSAAGSLPLLSKSDCIEIEEIYRTLEIGLRKEAQ